MFDRYLAAGADLHVLQRLLGEHAKNWASSLVAYRGPREQKRIDVSQPDAVRDAVVAFATYRGPTYDALVARFGAGADRAAGSAELRGDDDSLTVVVSIDEVPLSRLGKATDLGNQIAFQIRSSKIEGTDATTWVREVFEAACTQFSPAWAAARASSEYRAKVMSDPPDVAAIGRDFAKFLPGIFWLNFFGRRYCTLLGEDRLMTAPGSRVVRLDEGVLIETHSEPTAWESAEYVDTETAIRRHLGARHFFEKHMNSTTSG